jgi:hypothetical protein
VLPTTGIQLIGTIQNDLVKSSGINGVLGKAVKDIEKELLPLQRLSTT